MLVPIIGIVCIFLLGVVTGIILGRKIEREYQKGDISNLAIKEDNINTLKINKKYRISANHQELGKLYYKGNSIWIANKHKAELRLTNNFDDIKTLFKYEVEVVTIDVSKKD